MKFYTKLHDFYCGIDLHARILYVCILNHHGEKVLHQKIKAEQTLLSQLIAPYLGNIVVGVECMHCWYWVSDWCEQQDIDFVLGHALYMKAIHGGKAKNDKIDSYKIACLLRGGNFPLAYNYPQAMRSTRDLLRRRTKLVRHGAQLKAHIVNTNSQYNYPALELHMKNPSVREAFRHRFEDDVVQRNINFDLAILDSYAKELKYLEYFIERKAKQHRPDYYAQLRTIPGIGIILAMTILYEIGDIDRFESVQKFASYCRLVKCKAESAGKTYGTSGNKIGNGHLKWAFSEAAVLYLRGNDKARRYLNKLQKRMSKAKALSVLAHKIGRCVYYMLKHKTVFDDERFLTS
ncbi:IS110 family transposase [Litorilituus sediminis]|uniref:IS110 family transposase n=1 Tax=Litorilituus sediminis TaxID=718192 RepID=A0A4P6P211_9GAMM|nr:IS110 family transposase [Litorilituus sediminis]QBG34628.1 IS110 family transposase [Litorilituus sediminis]